MRMAFSNIAWEPQEDFAVARLMVQRHFSAVEIAPTKYWPAPCSPTQKQVGAIRDFWATQGVSVVSLQALLFGMPHLKLFDENVSPMLNYLEHIATIGAGLGATRLVFGSPKNRQRQELSEASAFEHAVGFFRQLAPRIHNLGLVLGVEPAPSQYGCDFATTASATLALVQAVGHPGVGIHLDSGGMQINSENFAHTVRTCAAHLCHVQASEPHLAPLGTAGVDHRAFGDALRCNGYDGFVSVEMRASANGQENLQRIDSAMQTATQAYS